jgi:hypothetical protein
MELFLIVLAAVPSATLQIEIAAKEKRIGQRPAVPERECYGAADGENAGSPLHVTLVVDQSVGTNLRSLLHDRWRHHKSVILDLETWREQLNRNPGGKDCPKSHAQQGAAEVALRSFRSVNLSSAHWMCSFWADSANRRENVSGKIMGAIRSGNGNDTNSSQQD